MVHSKKILIIEDEPNIVDYLTIYCKAEGYEAVSYTHLTLPTKA